MRETVEFLAVAEQEDISPVELRTIIDTAKAAKGEVTKRETTARANEPPHPAQPDDAATTRQKELKVQAVFGNIPPEFQTKRHSKSIIPEDAIHDPDVVQTAKDIVNANRRTKIETLEPKAQETLRIARRIVRANESRSQTVTPH